MPAAATLEKWRRGKTSNIPIFLGYFYLEGPLPAGDDVDNGVSNSIADGGTLASFSEEEETQSHNWIKGSPESRLSARVTGCRRRGCFCISLAQFHSVDFSQSRFASAVVDGVLGPLRLAPRFSVVPEAMHEVSWKPMEGSMSAQKSLQGSKTGTRDLLGGREKKSISWRGVIDLSSRHTNDLVQKKEQEKLS